MISDDAQAHARRARAMQARSLLVTALMLLALTPPARAVPMFTEPFQSIGTAIDPWSVAIGRLDSSNRLDLAVACWSSNTVNEFLQAVDGTFVWNGDQGSMSKPRSVAIADVNRDGFSDLLTASGAGVSVLMGDEDGSFGPMVTFPAGNGPEELAIADVDADGSPDVAVANYFSNTVSVLLGNGDGTLQPTTHYPSGTYTSAVALGDVNGDGRADLVATDLSPVTYNDFGWVTEGGEVTVRLGNGDGTFGALAAYPLGTRSAPRGVEIADLNADGRLDLVTANTGQDYNGSQVSVLLGNGDGTFAGPVSYTTGQGPYSLVIADFDADGTLDVATANSSGNSVSVLSGNGDGTLQAKVDWAVGGRAIALAAGDLNHDGLPDLAVATPYQNVVKLMLNGTQRLAVPVDPRIGASSLDLLAPNPTRDGSGIQYTVARAGHVRLDVADVTGRVVTTLFDGIQSPGRFQLAWDGTNGGERLPAGLFFVRLTTADRTVAGKITRLP